MIREVEIRGFKSLSQVDFELGRVNCIIGANGTGKSNLLEALGVLGAAANGIVMMKAYYVEVLEQDYLDCTRAHF